MDVRRKKGDVREEGGEGKGVREGRVGRLVEHALIAIYSSPLS